MGAGSPSYTFGYSKVNSSLLWIAALALNTLLNCLSATQYNKHIVAGSL